MQRDMLRIAEACHGRGHMVRSYAIRWRGAPPPWMELVLPPVRALTRPGRYAAFRRAVRRHLAAHPVDLCLGFNQMDFLDLYFAADGCYAQKLVRTKPHWYRHTPRARRFLADERALAASGCKMLCLTPGARRAFARHHGVERERLHLLGPGLAADRRAGADARYLRRRTRRALGVGPRPLLLFIGSAGYATKGLGAAIRALAKIPDALLLVVGTDARGRWIALSQLLGCGHRLRFLGGRDDIPALLLAADLLVHPARWENTGAVLLEALVAGLPVVCTSICGYAPHIARADAGVVLPSPVDQALLERTLQDALGDRRRLRHWRGRARQYAASSALNAGGSMAEQCLRIIES